MIKKYAYPLILVSLLSISIFYAFKACPPVYGEVFCQNTLSNFYATFLGLLVGIPIALWLNDIQQGRIDRIENAKIQKEILQRKKKILNSLKIELEKNLVVVESYSYTTGFDTDNFRSIFTTAVLPSLEVWQSFSDGGELQWLKDVNLLQLLGNAYHSIRLVKNTGQLLIETAYIQHPLSGKVITEKVHDQFQICVEYAIKDIQIILEEIK